MKRRSLAPWTSEELARHLARLCGTQFEVGPIEPDPKTKGHKFWVLMTTANAPITLMAVVRVSGRLDIRVDVKGNESRIVTIFRESLEFAAAKAVSSATGR